MLTHLLKDIDVAIMHPDSKESFRECMTWGFKLGVFTVDSAANELRVARPTVYRWCHGESAPHPITRTSVMRWLKKRVEEKLEARRESLDRLKVIVAAEQDLKDDRRFKEVVEKVLEFVVTPSEFREKYGMSPRTVARWRTGVSVPHLALRSRIYPWLKEKIETKLKN